MELLTDIQPRPEKPIHRQAKPAGGDVLSPLVFLIYRALTYSLPLIIEDEVISKYVKINRKKRNAATAVGYFHPTVFGGSQPKTCRSQ